MGEQIAGSAGERGRTEEASEFAAKPNTVVGRFGQWVVLCSARVSCARARLPPRVLQSIVARSAVFVSLLMGHCSPPRCVRSPSHPVHLPLGFAVACRGLPCAPSWVAARLLSATSGGISNASRGPPALLAASGLLRQ